jgi:hypothetical protein
MKYKIPVADLIDKLTVDHIKQFKFKKFEGDLESNIKNILEDIEVALKEKNIFLDYKIIRPLIILAQINLHIWNLKDEMEKDEKNYDNLLKLAHQLNGTRNKIKNELLKIFKEDGFSNQRSNFSTDGLEDWSVNKLLKK